MPSLVLAIHQNRHAPYSRFVQMATVRRDVRPANRTVVFRGFLNDSPRLTFVTDARSEKVAELEHCPWCQICWYFPVTHEQFRISGPVALVRDETDDAALRDARRRSLARAGRGGARELHLARAWRAARRQCPVFVRASRPGNARRLISVCSCSILTKSTFSRSMATRRTAGSIACNEAGRWIGAEVNP